MSAAEHERLAAGAAVVRTRTAPGFPWPEVTVHRRVCATPAEVIAVYVDWEAHRYWVPELAASRVVGRDAARVFRVYYEYEVAGPNERYTVTVTVHPASDGFDVSWQLVEARYAR